MTRFICTTLLALILLFSVSLPALAQGGPRTAQITATYSDKVQYDVYEADATAAGFTLTLTAPSKRRTVVVIKTDSTANAITVATAGTGATINGQSSFVLNSQSDAATFVANGRSGTNGAWRASASNRRLSVLAHDKTIATTGNTDYIVIAPEAGSLVAVDFSGTDALAANDTNYITYTIVNLGQAGAGSTAMLLATDVNTTKATGGTALAAGTKRTLSLHGTEANLVVAAGDRLRVRAAATGTLGNTVTFSSFLLRFASK